PVTREERAAERRRDGALLAADLERRALVILDDGDDAAVTGEPPHRLDRQLRAPGASAEGGIIDVHDDLVVVGGRRRRGRIRLRARRAAREVGPRDCDQRIRLLREPAVAARGGRTIAVADTARSPPRLELDPHRRFARRDRALEGLRDDLAVRDRYFYA